SILSIASYACETFRTVSDARTVSFCANLLGSPCGNWPNLAHPINHAFGRLRHRLVSFRQNFGQNRKVLHRILRTFRVGLSINNVGRRMPGKILFKRSPVAGQDPTARIETLDRSTENITRERVGCEVAAGRTSASV